MSIPKDSNKNTERILIIWCIITAVLILSVAAVLLIWAPWKNTTPTEPSVEGSAPSTQPSMEASEPSTQPSTEPSTVPTEPPIVKEAVATIAAVGDILPHMPIVRSYDFGEDGYVFDSIFDAFKPYIQSADLAIANLETTLAGADYADGYIAYPRFNSPDSIASALKNAGFDMLLTSNNHSYDTGHKGFMRTQQVLQELELAYLGTKLSAELPDYVVKEINGIRIGMVCYTYEGGRKFPDRKTLNITMTPEDSPLITSFNYDDLPGFYAHVQQTKAAMEAEGADAMVVFIHWGEEYHITQNTRQSTIAQGLCDLGVDVIVGGHPHVVQPMELLTSVTDPEHKTVCLYSMGNSLSNQRFIFMDLPTAHTEDGVMIRLTFARYSDGTVILETTQLLPTWVHMVYRGDGDNRIYTIYPLDDSLDSWKDHFGLDDWTVLELQASYNRTMEIVGPGLQDVQDWLAERTARTEAELGVSPQPD